MRSNPLVAQILDSLTDVEQQDDEQMTLLLQQLAALDGKDLPIAEIAAFLLTPCADSQNVWLLENDHFDTWEAGIDLIRCDPDCIPVEPVVAAVQHAYANSEPEEAEDTDEDDALYSLIELAGLVGARFPVEVLLPLLADERILIRRATIAALEHMRAGSPIVPMLRDVSAQIRAFAMQRLDWLGLLTPEQAQMLAVDPHPRVRAAALAWLQQHTPVVAPANGA